MRNKYDKFYPCNSLQILIIWQFRLLGGNLCKVICLNSYANTIAKLNIYEYICIMYLKIQVEKENSSQHLAYTVAYTTWHAQSCPILFQPHGLQLLPGSSVQGIFQARILEWVPFPIPGNLHDPGVNVHLLHLLCWQADSLPLCHMGISGIYNDVNQFLLMFS